MRETFCCWVVLVEPALCSYEQPPTFVQVEAPDVVVADTFIICGIMPENFKCIPIETVEAILGPQPHKTFFILQAAHHGIVRQAIFYLVVAKIKVALRINSGR